MVLIANEFNPIALLAFGFSNLAMLGWLAAAAAPLLIHLWSRRRYREVSWAAMEFLLAAMRRNARRLQLQQWLLLALRTLIIVLVVLAVAEPYANTLLARNSATPTHKVIALDNSYSMAYRDGDVSRFSRAKQLATDLVQESGPGDSFTLIVMGNPAGRILGGGAVDRTAIVQEIDTLRPSHAGADLSSTLELVRKSLSANESQSHPVDRQEVYFFTDLQRATWQLPHSRPPRENAIPRRSGGDEAAPSTQRVDVSRSHAERGNEGNTVRGDETFRERVAALAEKAALVVVDLAPPQRDNLAVTAISSPQPFVATGQKSVIETTLHEFGDTPRNQLSVELLVDDTPVAEQIVDVPAGDEVLVRFTHRFHSPGEHAVAIRTAGDSLEIDNARWLAVPVREAMRVLCVAGKPGAARYIASALDPDPTDDSPIRPIVATESDLAEMEFYSFDCIFFINVAQLTPNEAERLRRYAEHGGGVVFFLGDQVIADAYNSVVGLTSQAEQIKDEQNARNKADYQGSAPLGARHLLPARLGEVARATQFGIDPLDYRHPIVAPFRGRERAGLLTTPIARYFRLEVPRDGAPVEIAAATKSGDPLVVTSTIGRGRSIVVATDGSLSSIDPATGEPWTAWPTWPSFLPIVRELLNFAVSGDGGADQQLVGTPLSGSLAAYSTDNLVRVTRPDGRTDSIRATSGSAGAAWKYDRTNLSGIYTATVDSSAGSGAVQQRFAVNVDSRESDLTKANHDELPAELIVRNTWQDGGYRRLSSVAARAAIHVALLWTAFALLLFESLAAWYFGRGIA